MKTFAVALLLVASPLVAQVCPKKAPYPTSAITTRPYPGAVVEGRVAHIEAMGNSECGGLGPCMETAYFIQACDVVQWTFGDGTSATVTGLPSIDHTYAHFGVYPLSVHISNALGSTDVAGSIYVTRDPATTINAIRGMAVTESEGSVTVRIDRSGDLSRSNRVNWNLKAYGIAMTSTTGTFTFEPGESTHSLTFPVMWDHRYSGNFNATLILDLAPDGAISGQMYANYDTRYLLTQISVLEAEPVPTGILRDVTVPKGSASALVPLDLTNEFAIERPYWDYFKTIDGSARDGVDYVGTPVTFVVLKPDTNRIYLEIPLKPNKAAGTRTFDVEIDSTYKIMPFLRSRATVTIADDAPAVVADVRQMSLPLGAYGKITISPASPQTNSFVVSLSSSDPAVVPVPSTVLIPADRPAELLLHGINTGHATITITGGGGQTATVEVQVVQVRRRAVR